MAYTNEIKLQAKTLYVQGKSYANIAKELSCNRKTVAKWSRVEGWPAEKVKLYAESTALATQKASTRIVDLLALKMDAYQDMLLKGVQALPQTEVKSAAEAGQLIDKAIKGMENIKQEYINAKFITAVADVLKKEIQDKVWLRRIIDEIGRVYSEYHNKPVQSP
jgi:transposase